MRPARLPQRPTSVVGSTTVPRANRRSVMDGPFATLPDHDQQVNANEKLRSLVSIFGRRNRWSDFIAGGI